MLDLDDFRFQSHQLLIELDAATSEMMKLVSCRQTTGAQWDLASQRQHLAYEDWNRFLNQPVSRT